MTLDGHRKVTDEHLQRDAYLYVRQSTLRQVLENTESTKRQYALRQQATRLGWPTERIVVIDSDQGQSARTADRDGFQRLVTEVSMGRAGIVLGLEVSRLARNNVDWHRLLEICALTETLILDEDGLYDPRHFNDRLLLGMKGSFSEAELHVLQARLVGGQLAKARRGELKKWLPAGLVYDAQDHVVLDPDQQVQQAVRTLFGTYERLSSATATVKYFRSHGLLFPRRLRNGPRKGQVVWGQLVHSRVLRTLKNPRYAGVYVHGQTKSHRKPDGKIELRRVPREQWDTVLPDAHPGYITWEQFLRNQRRLAQSARAFGEDRRTGPPREGPALLQGLVVCGICGKRMTVRYESGAKQLLPRYVCQREGIQRGEPICQSIPGKEIDEKIGGLLLQMIEPLTLDAALAVQEELQKRVEEADRLRQQQVERARYQADLARERFMAVDPRNRLVANSLEADWNDKLRQLEQVQQDYEAQREADRAVLDEQTKEKVRCLATTFPRLWRNPDTPACERKRMVRLLIEDATLTKAESIQLQIRFKGGATESLSLPVPLPTYKRWQTDPQVVSLIDRMLDDHTEDQIAAHLNESGYHSGKGRPFKRLLIQNIRIKYGLRSRFDRLRERGMLTAEEIAEQLCVTTTTVNRWRRSGLLDGIPYERHSYLYEPLGEHRPIKQQGVKLNDSRRLRLVVSQALQEV
jgi:DNA invertase Pin-like site-specific DNA recombinase